MGQVNKLVDSPVVAQILEAEVNALAIARATRFLEGFLYSTTALFAIEVALREVYGDEPSPLADLVATIIRPAAAIEAEEI